MATFTNEHRKGLGLALVLAVGACVLSAQPASAIVVGGGSDTSTPATYATAPTPSTQDPGFSNVGFAAGNGTAVYLGNGWVITANHVGIQDVTFGDTAATGTTYAAVSGSGVQLHDPSNSSIFADLLMYKIADPGLSGLTIASDSPTLNQQVRLVGTGYGRTSSLTTDVDPGTAGNQNGYTWGGTRLRAWGNNNVGTITGGSAGFNNTYEYETVFNLGTGEAQATDKDSGSASFVYNTLTSQWELSGIVYAIGAYSGEPAGVSVIGQTTLIADLSKYADQINALVVPEPASMGLLAAAGLGLLARRRKA